MYVRYCSGLVTIVYGVKWCSIVHTESKPDWSAMRAISSSSRKISRSERAGPAATGSPRSSAS